MCHLRAKHQAYFPVYKVGASYVEANSKAHQNIRFHKDQQIFKFAWKPELVHMLYKILNNRLQWVDI